MDWHLAWLWLWFGVGMSAYMLKRGYYLITGSNPVANSWGQFFQRCWPPLLVRLILDSGVYWATFTPTVLVGMLRAMGWSAFANSVESVTHFGFFALFFGFGVDSVLDIAVSKIPWIKDFLPQMPPPLPQKAIVQAQIVEQKVTQLQTTTTVVPSETKP